MCFRKVHWLCVYLLPLFAVCYGADVLNLQRVQRTPFGQYGNVCNASYPCDRGANLACKYGVCECNMPERMIYDPDLRRCLVKAKEKCRYWVEQDELDRRRHSAQQVSYECVENATCHPTEGFCECNPGFYSDTRGQCWRQKRKGEECLWNHECQTAHGLVCWEGVCGCDPNESRSPQIYGSRHMCVGIPGGKCIHQECELNSHCVDGTCVCPLDSIWSEKERRCKAAFDRPCVDASFCMEEFDCINYRCKCKLFNQVYDLKTKKCLSIVSEPCKRNNECVPNAFCSKTKLCECKPGYIEFGPGFCRNGYGSACLQKAEENFYYVEKDSLLGSNYADFEIPREANEYRQDDLRVIKSVFNTCDAQRKLTCINGRCDCKRGDEVFDDKMGRCLGLVGTLCKMYERQSCVPNSECVPFTNTQKFGLGRCTCREGFHVVTNRTCEENYAS